jgi:hypothetical protein
MPLPTAKSGRSFVSAIAAVLEGSITFAIKVYQKKKSGTKIQNFTEDDWKEVGLNTLIGTGKGAIRGAAVYTMANYTPVPSPLASAMVTATFGVSAQARKLNRGDITKEDFVDNCEVVCLDVAISTLSSMLGEVLIPVPILGAIIGNAAGMFMYEISKTYLTSTEQKLIAKYQKDCLSFVQNLDSKYQEFICKLSDEMTHFSSLLALTFDGEMNRRFEASVALAIAAGADEGRILKNKAERDTFFSGEE